MDRQSTERLIRHNHHCIQGQFYPCAGEMGWWYLAEKRSSRWRPPIEQPSVTFQPFHPFHRWREQKLHQGQAISLMHREKQAKKPTSTPYAPSSLAQFLTKLEGHAMMHFSIVGFRACGDCLRRVHMRAMHWRVCVRRIQQVYCAYRSDREPCPNPWRPP